MVLQVAERIHMLDLQAGELYGLCVQFSPLLLSWYTSLQTQQLSNKQIPAGIAIEN